MLNNKRPNSQNKTRYSKTEHPGNVFRNFLKGWAIGLVGGYMLVLASIIKVISIRAYGCENIMFNSPVAIPTLLSFLPNALMFAGFALIILGPLIYWIILPFKSKR